MRLVAKKWCDLPGLEKLTRRRVIDANEWLDALEEAESEAARKAQEKAKATRGNSTR